ncbi:MULTISPECIES: substrate-binding domain-containing protein [unclassified Oceanispirochaeta]|uniref:GntR family transcriptional regulator n=1 Tax=unclassified Oceanispirochaeta TaxID=2635722 RepID=UPI000E0911A4|nr:MULTISPECIES: GntR family transcriptional regulator [unclassified Oceanispirochaeta]MBF9015853.1 GntR family transcriptional regulator [Oceanispirochaeta sp. M2]NPD72316.1 GntR family transcriptional regulator [Oceanispirochaeta sp. M1]RDG32087.1 GntR family transcriptional regulator [Oceanispirochaeta sp. M1]
MKEPQYYKIYKHIINRINSGELQDGATLETEMELTKQFNVSRVTIRKALELLVNEGFLSRQRGKGSVVMLNEDTRRNAGLQSHFTPSFSMAGGGQRVIGFILPDFSSGFEMKIVEGMEKEAEKHGFFLVMKLTKGDQKLEEKAIRNLLALGVTGLIILPQHGEFYNPVIMELSIKGFPFVLVDRELRGLKSSFVGTDNIAAAYQAVQYLYENGHRNILYLTPPVRNTSALEDRMEGARSALDAFNIPCRESLFLSDFQSTIPMPDSDLLANMEADKKILIDFFSREKGVTAIFASEYRLALLASDVLKELNLRIPEDISIICFDSPIDYFGQFSFTHLRQNEYGMGELAMEMLNRIIEGESDIQKKVLPAELVHGTTTSSVS